MRKSKAERKESGFSKSTAIRNEFKSLLAIVNQVNFETFPPGWILTGTCKKHSDVSIDILSRCRSSSSFNAVGRKEGARVLREALFPFSNT
jgi:hypothetical protein